MAKSAQASAKKFVDRASVAGADYVDGVKNSGKSWSAAAKAAAGIYKSQVTKAANEGRYEKGIDKSSDAAHLKGVVTVGEARFGEGVAAAATKYATNSASFDTARSAAASMPRGAKGSPENLARVGAVVKALRAQKVGASA